MNWFILCLRNGIQDINVCQKMLCKHYQNGNLIRSYLCSVSCCACSKVIILLSYNINLFFLFKFRFLQWRMKRLVLLRFLFGCFNMLGLMISYLNWNVNKLDVEGELFNGRSKRMSYMSWCCFFYFAWVHNNEKKDYTKYLWWCSEIRTVNLTIVTLLSCFLFKPIIPNRLFLLLGFFSALTVF